MPFVRPPDEVDRKAAPTLVASPGFGMMKMTMANPHHVLEIHSDLVMKGELSMTKDVILTGKFEGELKTDGCLTVSSGGVAVGAIEAGALVLQPGNLVEARVKIAPPQAASAGRTPRGDRSTPKIPSGAKWPSLRKLKDFALGRA